MINKIHTESAPAAIGPYSQAIINSGLLFTSGQIGIVPETGLPDGDDITSQTRRICMNLSSILTQAGTSFDKVIKTTCFLKDMNDFSEFNAVYAEFFTSLPARSCVAVKQLPKDMLAEIELIAAL